MNYGKRSTSKKRNALISRTSMLEKRAHVSFIRVLFTALIAVCVMPCLPWYRLLPGRDRRST